VKHFVDGDRSGTENSVVKHAVIRTVAESGIVTLMWTESC